MNLLFVIIAMYHRFEQWRQGPFPEPAVVTKGAEPREHAAFRLEIVAGLERGSCHDSTRDVRPSRRPRPRPALPAPNPKGQGSPVRSPVSPPRDSGRIAVSRFASGLYAAFAVAAVRAHYADPEANKPTRIAAPADMLEPAPAEAQA